MNECRQIAKTSGRRRFVANVVGAVAGTLGGLPGAVAGEARESGAIFQAARFRECLGSGFRVRAMAPGSETRLLTLSRVELAPFPVSGLMAKSSAFSIDLVGASQKCEQDTYVVTHPRLGEFLALLVPTADGNTLVGTFVPG